jgi:hypothetical protein
MRPLALILAFFIMCVGVTGIFMPETLLSVRRYVVTPNGLYAVAALRVGIGLVLMSVARVSRAPKTLRTLGAVVCVARDWQPPSLESIARERFSTGRQHKDRR